MNEHKLLRTKITRARINLLFMIFLSAFNIFFIYRDFSISFPFSCSTASLLAAFANVESDNGKATLASIIFLSVAIIIILLFVFCYFLSKKHPVWMLIALILFTLDTGALIIMLISGIYQASAFIDICLHGLLLYYLFTAAKAHLDLKKLPEYDKDGFSDNYPENDFGAISDVAAYNSIDYEEDALYNDDVSEPLTEPIGKYEGSADNAIVSGTYAGLNCFVVILEEKALMIINDYICDEIEISESIPSYELRAIVNGIDFKFEYESDSSKETVYLYADSELLDSFGKHK